MKKILNELFDGIYVISHKKSDRIENVKKRLEGVDFEFFFGPEKEDIDIEQLVKDGYPKWCPHQFAATFTHMDLMNKLKNEKKTKNILVLEDDILLKEENLSYLENEFNIINGKFDLFYLGMVNNHINYDIFLKPNISKHLYKLERKSLTGGSYCLEGTSSYVIGNETFIDKCLEYQKSKSEFKVIDGLFWNIYGQIESYAILPQIFIQDLDTYSGGDYSWTPNNK
jgi:GR25 family glycosyltransferase involved in LPS biosynthesis